VYTREGGNRVEELRKMVQGTVGDGVQVEGLWYSLKYDINMIMTVERDMDVRMMLKRNNEHEYLYVGGKNSLGHHVSKGEGQLQGGQGLVIKEYDVEQVVESLMVMLKVRYKQVAHIGQGNSM